MWVGGVEAGLGRRGRRCWVGGGVLGVAGGVGGWGGVLGVGGGVLRVGGGVLGVGEGGEGLKRVRPYEKRAGGDVWGLTAF